jgi:cell wall-associated NlpC family hydrolase
MDRRLYPATDRIAHRSLGRADLPATDGQVVQVTAGLADLLRSPNDARERQLPFGTAFCVIDRDQGHAFGFAVQDGYCGWLNEMAFGDLPAATHWVKTTGTHLYPEPRVQSREIMPLPMGAQICVLAQHGGFAETPLGFVPLPHLTPKGQFLTDPAGVAEQFLGTPYLWGGRTGDGIDCSGLVQAALLACGLGCPRDSDQQLAEVGAAVAYANRKPGDLVFFNTLRNTFSHVGIYIGDGKFVHSPSSGATVRVDDMRFAYWNQRFTGARRAEASNVPPAAADPATGR